MNDYLKEIEQLEKDDGDHRKEFREKAPELSDIQLELVVCGIKTMRLLHAHAMVQLDEQGLGTTHMTNAQCFASILDFYHKASSNLEDAIGADVLKRLFEWAPSEMKGDSDETS